MAEGIYLGHPSSLAHDTGGHPERAERIVAIERELEARGWLGYRREEAPAVSRKVLEAVHARDYVDAIERICAEGGGMLDLDTVASPGSWEAALHAAGGPVRAVDELLGGQSGPAFCALRPPGHHAEVARAMGFCLFNNVAVAAALAIDRLGAERVMVFDWDVHHGNGTAEAFRERSDVLFASIHQMPLYPGTGLASDTGSGPGEGYTLNLPVPPGSGEAEWLALVGDTIVPAAEEFRPDLILISAGYDAHRLDPLAGCELEAASFARMATLMRELASGLGVPLGAVQEGGYQIDSLVESLLATIEALRD